MIFAESSCLICHHCGIWIALYLGFGSPSFEVKILIQFFFSETVQVVIHTPAAADRPLTLEAPNITFTPSVLTAPETLVSIQTSQSDHTELDVLFKLGNESAISNPVGIKVMKRNTI